MCVCLSELQCVPLSACLNCNVPVSVCLNCKVCLCLSAWIARRACVCLSELQCVAVSVFLNCNVWLCLSFWIAMCGCVCLSELRCAPVSACLTYYVPQRLFVWTDGYRKVLNVNRPDVTLWGWLRVKSEALTNSLVWTLGFTCVFWDWIVPLHLFESLHAPLSILIALCLCLFG